MNFEWKKYTIADVSKKVITGKTPPGTLDKYFGGDVLFVTPTDMGDNKYIERTQRTLSDEGEAKLAKQKFKCGIVVSCIGWQMGKSAIVKNAAVTNQQVNTIIPNNELIDVDFLYYILSDKRTEIFNLGATATRTPILKKSLFEKIDFYAPKLEQQKKIGSILSYLDNKIINNQKINQTLEQMAQALFKSWFVDFEPVKAKMAVLEAGGSQEDATLAAMTAISGKDVDALMVFEHEHSEQYAELKATAELFPSAMQDSELGDIPASWILSEIGKETEMVGGATPSTKTPEFWDNGNINWTTPKDLSGLKDKILLHTERKITKAGLSKISSGLLPVNTVLMSARAPVGYLAIAKIPVAINQGYIAMKCNKDLSPEFLLQWCVDNMPEIVSRASGTTFAEISKKNFNPIPLVKPPENIVKVYTKKVNAIYSLIGNNIIENNSLTQLRDVLLPKLLSGEITLPEPERAVSETENV